MMCYGRGRAFLISECHDFINMRKVLEPGKCDIKSIRGSFAGNAQYPCQIANQSTEIHFVSDF